MGNLQEDLKRAQDGFAMGQFEYSRSVTKSALGHCFRCHSVTKEGNTSVWDVGEIHKLNLAPLEKADLLVAARKFDQATTYMESLLKSDEFLANHAFDFEALLRRYLALMIRVESDPERAMQGLEQVLEKGNTPHYIVDQAEGWRKSLQRWASEKKSPIKSAKELFKRVENHFKRAESLQNYEKDHAGDVEYLRITSLLHEGLKLTKEPKDQARALYLLGRAYEVLDELGSWNLHENYYESCVLKAPKSPVARRCYSRLEASLYMGYSGSSGTHLPGDVKKRLQFLKQKL